MSDLIVSFVVLQLTCGGTRFCWGLSGTLTLKGVFCSIKSALGLGVSGDIELSHVDVRSSLLAFGIPAISIAFSFASAIAIFLSAVRNASSIS